MAELMLLGAAALYLIAAASPRHRAAAGVASVRAARLLRLAAVALLAVALARSGASRTGERWVWLLCVLPIEAIALTLVLSAAPAICFAPLRRALRSTARSVPAATTSRSGPG